MKVFVMVCLLSCIACGGNSLLNSGTYNVRVEYTYDSWPYSMAGQTTQATWKISEDNAEYKLDVVDGSQDLPGTEIDERVIFEKDQLQVTSGCENGQTFLLILYPNKNGNEFNGYGQITVSAGEWGGVIEGCNRILWLVTEVTVDGKQR